MAWRSVMMGAGRVALAAPLAALLAALLGALLVAADLHEPTLDPAAQFEAAFQGRCGEGSPCEQLCSELHDGTYECGCGPGYVLHVNGYGCLELNSTKTTEATLDSAEDVLYQKDVSFSAELEVAPSNRVRPMLSPKTHITDRSGKLATAVPEKLDIDNYTYTGERSKEAEGLRSLMEDGISKTDLNIIADEKELQEFGKVTTLGPSLEQKVPGATGSPAITAAVDSCSCSHCGGRCPCPTKCKTDSKVTTPRFSGSSWVALRALRGAYKRVRVRVRVRPERTRGVLLLTGEHDDLSGDYLALVLRNSHVELRFDCGSGAGILRSPEPVRLGHWNTISVYRHRWDAWLRLNNGKRVRGRSKTPSLCPSGNNDAGNEFHSFAERMMKKHNASSELEINTITFKGLFSRMTFREPVWVGGAGNTTGLQSKLGLSDGLLGCVDFLRINGDTYQLVKDAVATMDIGECAPTLAPWRPTNEVTTIEATSQPENKHAIYDINDIVHFEDNDLVMRDSKTKHDDNKLDNSIEPFKSYDMKNIQVTTPSRRVSSVNDVINDMKNDDTKPMKEDKDVCECQHGGGCVGHVCLCPLGYAGIKCEITLDLKITLKPTSGEGLVLYNSEHASGDGDFFSLHLRDYYMEFAFDLGNGMALVRSAYPLQPNIWHNVTATRVARLASLMVETYGHHYDFEEEVRVTRWVRAAGAARRLTLKQPLLLGGAPAPLPPRLALAASYSGCVGQLIINDVELSVVSSALGGLNVDNCEEPANDSNCTDSTLCKEVLQMPIYPQNLSENDVQHSIVAKKGFKLKYHKTKPNKHPHLDRKKKKYFISKKRYLETNDVMTERPYDGQTYMQIKYLSDNEMNWVDAITYPSFSGTDSFIHIDDEETMKRLRRYTLDINIRFRSDAPNALLVWSGRPPRDFLSLAIEDSALVLRYDLGSGEVVIVANHSKVDDGLWHRARATRNRQAGVLEVDGLGSIGKISPGKHKQLNTDNGLYIGGLPSIEMNTMGKYKAGLFGCVSQISLSGNYDIPLSLSKLPHTITNNVGRCAP